MPVPLVGSDRCQRRSGSRRSTHDRCAALPISATRPSRSSLKERQQDNLHRPLWCGPRSRFLKQVRSVTSTQIRYSQTVIHNFNCCAGRFSHCSSDGLGTSHRCWGACVWRAILVRCADWGELAVGNPSANHDLGESSCLSIPPGATRRGLKALPPMWSSPGKQPNRRPTRRWASRWKTRPTRPVTNRLVTVGDSLTQGFQSLAIFKTDLSWPALVAAALGLKGPEFRYPTYEGYGGLPFNLEVCIRGLQTKFGRLNLGNDPLAVIWLLAFAHDIKHWWTHEADKSWNPLPGLNHNLAVYSYDVQTACIRTLSEIEAAIANPPGGSSTRLLPTTSTVQPGGCSYTPTHRCPFSTRQPRSAARAGSRRWS